MATLLDIYNFLRNTQKVSETMCVPTYDLERDMGITGDDFVELVEEFAEAFNVDMTTYLWYFHHSEEPVFNPGAIFFKPAYYRVKHIPVTPLLLLEAANMRRWTVKYPDHILPSRRYDIYISYFFVGLLVLFMVLIF